jgi:hypothetical protein
VINVIIIYVVKILFGRHNVENVLILIVRAKISEEAVFRFLFFVLFLGKNVGIKFCICAKNSIAAKGGVQDENSVETRSYIRYEKI